MVCLTPVWLETLQLSPLGPFGKAKLGDVDARERNASAKITAVFRMQSSHNVAKATPNRTASFTIRVRNSDTVGFAAWRPGGKKGTH